MSDVSLASELGFFYIKIEFMIFTSIRYNDQIALAPDQFINTYVFKMPAIGKQYIIIIFWKSISKNLSP